MDTGMQKHRIMRWLGKYVAALLLVQFAMVFAVQAAEEVIKPSSGGTYWDYSYGQFFGPFPTAEAACRAASSLTMGFYSVAKYTYAETLPSDDPYPDGEYGCKKIGCRFCSYTNIAEGKNYVFGYAFPRSDAVCPAPTANPTVPYTYNAQTGMCERPQVNLIITLSGDTSVEPWHKKADADHKKTNLKYTATVKDASDQPAPNIEVTITTDVTQDSGGHVHIDGRNKGKLAIPTDPIKDGKETITGNTDNNGVYSFVFGSEEASGTHALTAKCSTGCEAPATSTVKVEIKGLSLLDRDPLSYTLNGETSTHPGSHYFSAAAMTKIINLAHKYSHDPAFNKQLLIINDSSLIKGGVFDLGQDWTYEDNGHQGHRIGIVVDVNNYHDGPNQKFVEFAKECCSIKAVWEGTDVTSTPHYHLRLLGKDQ